MKRSRDEIDRIRKKSLETVESVDDFIHRSSAMAGKMGGRPVVPSEEVKREINKLAGVRDRLKTKINDLKDHPEKTVLLELVPRVERQWETLKSMEKASNKAHKGSGGNNNNDKTQQWIKEAIRTMRQRITTLESDATRDNKNKNNSGGAGNPSSNNNNNNNNQNSRNNNNNNRGSNKPSSSETIEQYQSHLSKLEMTLGSLNNNEIRADEVDGIRGEVKDLFRDKVDADTLSRSSWYEKLFSNAKLGGSGGNKSGGNNKDGGRGGHNSTLQPPLPRSSSHQKAGLSSGASAGRGAGGVGGVGTTTAADLLDGADEGRPAWADDDDADANNDDTFGDVGTPGVGSLADLMQSTQAMLLKTMPADAERRRQECAAARNRKAQTAGHEEDDDEQDGDEKRRRRGTADGADNTNNNTSASRNAAAAERKDGGAGTSSTTSAGGKTGSTRDPNDLDEETVAHMLEMSLYNLNHPLDADRPRPFQPPNAVEPMDSFPSEIHPVLSQRHIYEHFDDSSLFFIFYYHQKNYQNHYAARELRRRRYRFRKSDTRWYRGFPAPSSSTATPAPAHAQTPPVASTPTNAQPQQPVAEQPAAPSSSTTANKTPPPAIPAPEKLRYFDYQLEWQWKEAESSDISPDDFEP